MSSNPFAALFEEVDQASDPMLAEAQLSDVMFAPLPPPETASRAPAPKESVPVPEAGASKPAAAAPVRETIAPIRSARRSSPITAEGTPSIQQALVVTLEKRGEPDLDELNDLLASGWRVTRTEAFHPADGGGRTSMLVVVEQEAPK